MEPDSAEMGMECLREPRTLCLELTRNGDASEGAIIADMVERVMDGMTS
tara:strand:+ start:37010 stop:37156 length:147 start_codon:yes stop_codon:yes gene_type:complete